MRKSDPAFSPAALAALIFGGWHLPRPVRIKVAYSGGLDSHVLLDAFVQLRVTHDIALSAWHINHGLQPAAASWAEHCARICREYAVPFQLSVVRATTVDEEGMEAAARRARYAAFRDGIAPGEFLVLAHQRDDQAETVLLQLLRGTGLAGLAAMPERVGFGAGEMLRPLLGFSRASLHAYAQSRGLQWIEDPSNLDTRLRRNYLRREIMPRLREQWPGTDVLLARNARHVAEALELLDLLAASDLSTSLHVDDRKLSVVSISVIERLPPARQRNALRYWLRRQGFLPPSLLHLDTLLAQMRIASRSHRFRIVWPGIEIWRYRDALVALKAVPLPDASLDLVWDTRSSLDVPGLGRLRGERTRGAGIAVHHFDGRLRVRLRQGGETLRLPGRKHHHVLKKLLQDQGVAPWLRPRLPVFYAGDKLAAIADLWVDADYAAKPDEEGFAPRWEPFPDRYEFTPGSEKSR